LSAIDHHHTAETLKSRHAYGPAAVAHGHTARVPRVFIKSEVNCPFCRRASMHDGEIVLLDPIAFAKLLKRRVHGAVLRHQNES